MTVGELKDLLRGIPKDYEVKMRITDQAIIDDVESDVDFSLNIETDTKTVILKEE